MPHVPSRRVGLFVGALLVVFTVAGCGSSTPAAVPSAVLATAAPTTAAPTTPPTSAPAAEATIAPTSAPAATIATPTDDPASSPLAATELDAIGTTVAQYMFATPTTAFALVVDGVSGDIVRVTAVPTDFDQTTIFLKKGADGWQILSAGTAFPPDSLAELKIPQELAEQPADFATRAAPLNAAATYLNQQEQLTKFYTVADASEGDFARVRSIAQQTDPAYIFLKREGESWKVLTYGTAFGPDDYQTLGIPASLQVP